MVSTVAISTITVIATSSIVAGIGIFILMMLIGFLSAREVLHASGGVKQKLLAKSLLVGIIPLLIGFLVIVAMKVAEILA